MKKALSFIVSIVLLATTITPALAASPEVTREEKFAHLIECGIPESVLNAQDDYSINSMYEESLTHHIELASFDVSYGLTPVDESGIALAAISDGNFEMNTTVLSVYDSDRVTFRYYAVYTKYEWTDPPTFRKTDGITVNWDSELLSYMSGTFYYDPSYKSAGSSSWINDTTNYTTTPDTLAQGGIGLTFNLYDGYNYYLRGTVFVRLAKRNASASGSYTTINSNYAHTTEELAAESLTIGLTDVNTTFVCEKTYQNSASSASVTIP